MKLLLNEDNVKNNLLIVLFLIYSLLPGFSKLFNIRELFVLNVFVIPFILFLISKRKIQFKYYDSLGLVLIAYFIVNQIFVLLFYKPLISNYIIGLYSYGFPFFGFFLSRYLKADNFIKIVYYIVVVHVILGFIFYNLFPFHLYLPYNLSKISDGVMFGRMASVSGSLGFSALMIFGVNIVLLGKNQKGNFIFNILIVIGLILSLQRSAWLSLVLSSFIYLFKYNVVINKRKLSVLILVSLILFVLLTYIENLDFIFSRFTDFGYTAVTERSSLWLNGIDNFLNYPLGIGFGQVGQVANEQIKEGLLPVPDGDFLRIIAEFGLFGIIQLIFFVLILIKYLNYNFRDNNILVLFLIFVSLLIQMIGSNTTEFYFVNFLFWIVFGYLVNFKICKDDKLYNCNI